MQIFGIRQRSLGKYPKGTARKLDLRLFAHLWKNAPEGRSKQVGGRMNSAAMGLPIEPWRLELIRAIADPEAFAERLTTFSDDDLIRRYCHLAAVLEDASQKGFTELASDVEALRVACLRRIVSRIQAELRKVN